MPTTDIAPLVPAIVEPLWAKGLIAIAAYVITVGLSGDMVRAFVPAPKHGAEDPPDNAAEDSKGPRWPTGMVIGKCENVITVTLVLANQATGLAVIFAAKSLVRGKDIQRDAGYYLGGTLVNFAWGLLVASIARVLIFGVAG